MENTKKCVLCGKPIKGFGNNAEPLKEGLCCDECNKKIVATARMIINLYEKNSKEMENFIIGYAKAEVGKWVLILDMKKEPQYKYKCGIIECIDDAGQIHGSWGGCALVEGDVYWVFEGV